MKTEKKTENSIVNEHWRTDLKDAGIEFKEENVFHEIIDGKDVTVIFGRIDEKGFLKMEKAYERGMVSRQNI